MVEVKTYQAIASRGDRYWVVHILGLGNNPDVGLPTQARTLAEVEPMVRDLIALWLEVPEDSFSINVQVHLPESVQKHLQHANELRTAADAARSEAAAKYRAAPHFGFLLEEFDALVRFAQLRSYVGSGGR